MDLLKHHNIKDYKCFPGTWDVEFIDRSVEPVSPGFLFAIRVNTINKISGYQLIKEAKKGLGRPNDDTLEVDRIIKVR